MAWARPVNIGLAPLAVLALGALLLVLNPFGLESALADRLLEAWRTAAPQVDAPRALLPLRLAELLWLLAWGGVAIASLRFGLAACTLAAVLGGTLPVYFGWLLFLHAGIFVDAATIGLGLALLLAAAAASYLVMLYLARLSLRVAFSDSLPRASIEKIARQPSLLKIDGEVREISYLVCGVRGLAEMGATFRDDPATFTRLMQQVLTPLMDQALAHGGTIDRLTADGFAAFWNAPLDDADHATHACEAANGMIIMASRVSDEIVQQRRADGTPLPVMEIGIGVATGPAIAGGFGGHGRMGYSVNGDAVTLAGRIQALSHQYGPAVIVSDATQQAALRSFAFLEVDMVAAGASDPPVTLFAILGNPVVRASPKFRALATFHDHIFQALRKQQWQQARALIAQCRRLSGASQKLYDLHLSRIGYFENHPPGDNWDGAFRPILK